MRQKLADEAADGTGSILSEQADLESVKSEGDVQSPEPIQVRINNPQTHTDRNSPSNLHHPLTPQVSEGVPSMF